jgi:small subunit ribosomal protein S18
MLKNKKTMRPKKRLAVVRDCAFCKEHKEPTFESIDSLKRFLTERGKILARSRSGLCAMHQRRFTEVVKQARFLALLAFTSRD